MKFAACGWFAVWLMLPIEEPSPSAGLAGRYPGDVEIDRAPSVLFAENFESGNLDDLAKRWTEQSNRDGQVFAWSDERPSASSGKRSLQMTARVGTNTGGHLYKLLPKNVDKLHARFYTRFADEAKYIHHYVQVGGHHPRSRWPSPRAGERPKGNDRLYVGIEPHGVNGRFPPPGVWSFYSYWPEMKVSAGGRFWGNAIRRQPPLLVPAGRWQCVEVMVELNSEPAKSDGKLALWLDGTLAMRIEPGTRIGQWTGMGFDLPEAGGEPFPGFRWRTAPELQLNFFWLLHYVTEHATRSNRVGADVEPNCVWFDDIVLATEYIGPIAPEASARTGKTPVPSAGR